MNRNGQTVFGVDNAYYHQGTGYIMWETGIGRDNCRYPWSNTNTEPSVPFHGIIYSDGNPWSVDNLKFIRNDDLSTLPVFNVEYYANNNFTNVKKTSITPSIDFDLGNEFGTGSPDTSVGIGVDNFWLLLWNFTKRRDGTTENSPPSMSTAYSTRSPRHLHRTR